MRVAEARAPRELAWAWWGLIVVGVLVEIGQRRTAKKLREAREANADFCREQEQKLGVAETRVERQANKIAELNFELDGPIEEDAGERITPARVETDL